MTGDWRCGLCPETGTGGLDGFERHYMTRHYRPPTDANPVARQGKRARRAYTGAVSNETAPAGNRGLTSKTVEES